MEKHEQRDAVRASMLMVPRHEVYRTRLTPPDEEDHHRGGELHENEPVVNDEDHGEW